MVAVGVVSNHDISPADFYKSIFFRYDHRKQKLKPYGTGSWVFVKLRLEGLYDVESSAVSESLLWTG